jgi:molybdopterin-guanine dinucleotide biosynthesis protein MobB
MVVSAKRWAHITELQDGPEPTLDDCVARLGDVDLVLVEGWKLGGHPRLELRCSGNEAPELAGHDKGIVAIVSDGPLLDNDVPVLPRDDVSAIAGFILHHVQLAP